MLSRSLTPELLFFAVIVIAMLSSLVSSNIVAQPSPAYRCAVSPIANSHASEMKSVVLDIMPAPITGEERSHAGQFIHMEKETFECRATPPFQSFYNLEVEMITRLNPALKEETYKPVLFVICKITSEGNVTGCRGPFPPPEGVTNNLTRCVQEPVEHPIAMSSDSWTFGSAPGTPNNNNPAFEQHRGAYATSETHVYKCSSDNAQLPNKLKIVTIFRMINQAPLADEERESKTWVSACVIDIVTPNILKKVESCQVTRASSLPFGSSTGSGNSGNNTIITH